MARLSVGLLAAGVLAACGPAHLVESGPAKDLHALAADYWEHALVHSPRWATSIGDRRFDHKLEDPSPDEAKRLHDDALAFRGRLSGIDPATLSGEDLISYDVLADALDGEIATFVCHEELWAMDPLGGPQVTFAELPNSHTIRSRKDIDTLIARYRAMPAYFQTKTQAILEGRTNGYIAPVEDVERTAQEVEDEIAGDHPQQAFVEAVKLPEGWSPAEKEAAKADLRKAVEEGVLPGLTTFRDFLRDHFLAGIGQRNYPGVYTIPEGRACYAAKVRQQSGSTKTPDELHQLGLSEVARIGEAMEGLAKKRGFPDAKAYRAALRADPKEFLGSRQAVLAHGSELLTKALAALPKAFGKLPKTRIEVKAIEEFREKDSPAGYYYGAPKDGSRPAWLYLNTYDPKSRPLYDMAALAFHEGVPGHHLQIALANENRSLPEFRRQIGPTAFVEGWALYSEGLAEELGLYGNDDERYGKLDYEMWRACRLVIDTGIHSKGWGRQQALDYLLDHTALSEVEAGNEIDRYITWPGQALAYKVGELEIRSIRAEAEKALGPRFDLKAFHDRLLSHGAIPLAAARKDIERWAGEQKPRATESAGAGY